MIDRIIDKNNLIEKKKYKNIALTQLRIPLNDHIRYLFNLYKATALTKPEMDIVQVKDLFCEDYFAQLAFLDFSKKAPVYPEIEYLEYCFQESRKFKESLSHTLDKYSIYLPAETIEIFEYIINSTFLSFLSQIRSVHEMDKRDGFRRNYNFLSGNGVMTMVREYSAYIINLVEIVNTNLESKKQINVKTQDWSNIIAPLIGSGRIK